MTRYRSSEFEVFQREVEARESCLIEVEAAAELDGGLAAYKIYVNGNVRRTPARLTATSTREVLPVAPGSYRIVLRAFDATDPDRIESNTLFLTLSAGERQRVEAHMQDGGLTIMAQGVERPTSISRAELVELLTVVDTFALSGMGLTLLPDFEVPGRWSGRHEAVVLVRPDGTEAFALAAINVVHLKLRDLQAPSDKRWRLTVSLPGTSKDEVPVGTRVFGTPALVAAVARVE